MFWKGRGQAVVSASVVVPLDADRAAVEAAKRDPAAFDQLYRKYVAHIYSLALYETRDPHAAEDITAVVFERALGALPRFREEADDEGSTFKVWLYAIARNVVANTRRQARRHPEEPLDLALELRSSSDPAAETERGLEAQRVWQAVMELPAERRQVVILRFVNELSAREIGQVMGRSEGAVRVLLHRALASVRARLAA